MCASSGGPLAYVEVIIRKKKKVAEEKITKRNIGFISLLLIYYGCTWTMIFGKISNGGLLTGTMIE